MGADGDELAFLAESIRRTLDAQQQEAQHLLDLSPPRGTLLAQGLIDTYETVRALVAEKEAAAGEYDDAEHRQGVIEYLRVVVVLARSFQNRLEWLDAAREPVLDLGTQYLIDHIASQLISPNAEVTVVASGDGSYAKIVTNLSNGAVIIVIPRRERRSGLLHPLIVHELGHEISDRHGLATGLRSKVESDHLEALDAAATTVAVDMEQNTNDRAHILNTIGLSSDDVTDEEGLTEAARQYLLEVVKYCLAEAVCDAIAIHLLGPTYLYAFAAIVGTSDLDAVDPQHPSTRLRIALMLEQLDELGWTETMQRELPAVDTWFRTQAKGHGPTLEPAQEFSARIVKALRGETRTLVADHVSELAFSADSFDSDRSDAIKELLAVGIPPAQVQDLEHDEMTTIDRPEIILSSWLYAMQQGGDGLGAIAAAPGLPELSELLPKALELSALLGTWEESD